MHAQVSSARANVAYDNFRHCESSLPLPVQAAQHCGYCENVIWLTQSISEPVCPSERWSVFTANPTSGSMAVPPPIGYSGSIAGQSVKPQCLGHILRPLPDRP
ncbi:hypothetical protein CCC_01529 [Paramagnetospirillum magnetotacticum MS-1]|uniref:Uncharacterized protein n=1 Tax=Paramagnetospirillum magnetotacticum MS-1 TaxID=272627 RepID=A0A0C2YZ56_PARME|nr:hypothetical protein CCC_01529 [Paramagnetospirillum magnetotacticum MS-1]